MVSLRSVGFKASTTSDIHPCARISVHVSYSIASPHDTSVPNRPSRVRTVLRPARAYSTLLLHFKYFVFLSFVIPCMCADRLLRCAHPATSRPPGPTHSAHSHCLESLHRLLSFVSPHLHKDEEGRIGDRTHITSYAYASAPRRCHQLVRAYRRTSLIFRATTATSTERRREAESR